MNIKDMPMYAGKTVAAMQIVTDYWVDKLRIEFTDGSVVDVSGVAVNGYSPSICIEYTDCKKHTDLN